MPKKAFQQAVDTAEHLQWHDGLQAVKKSEGGGQIVARDHDRLLGGACIDDDCKSAYPTANRWDYVIGYRRANKPVAYFIEVHSAETSEVSVVEKKLAWLRLFLSADEQASLARLDREIHWVASGRIAIPKHTPQFRRLNSTLRALGLKGPTRSLELV